MKHTDSLGDRMKRYEGAYTHTLTPRSPVIIRVDGRAFHTFTRHMAKPFDRRLMDAMVGATIEVGAQMQGFKLAYTQSDEATFLLTDFDGLNTGGWFGYELNKLVSLSASMFTAHFNHEYGGRDALATFDARAFVVPFDDVPNMFIWRQQDWARNSLQMLARAHFPHHRCHGKKRADLHDMLHEIGVDWADLAPDEKNGTFIVKSGSKIQQKLDYDKIRGLLEGLLKAEDS